jgi:MFS transporter, ACS family, hexuronate transporter
VAPLVVPAIALAAGWQAAFLVTGLLGLFWVVAWLPLYDRPERVPRVSPEELAWIRSDPPDPGGAIPWVRLLPHRQTWTIAAGKFLTDPIWWFYLFWSAKFFADRFGADLKRIGPPLIAIYLLADVGSVAGGWLSSRLIARGWTANAARKTALLACALCVIPVAFAPLVSQMWAAVLLIGLAAAAHQGFSANIYTLASDMFPRRAVGSGIGIAGMGGAVGGILMQAAVGRIKERTGSYLTMFAIAGTVYILSVLIIHGLAPRLAPAAIRADSDAGRGPQ